MFCNIGFVFCRLEEPFPRSACIGHGFLGSKSFGCNEEKRFLWIYLFKCFRDMSAIYIGNKIRLYPFLPVRLERLSYHIGAQVTASDTDINDIAYIFAGIPLPFAAMNTLT